MTAHLHLAALMLSGLAYVLTRIIDQLERYPTVRFGLVDVDSASFASRSVRHCGLRRRRAAARPQLDGFVYVGYVDVR